MRRTCTIAATALLLAGCGGGREEPGNTATAAASNAANSAVASNATAMANAAAASNAVDPANMKQATRGAPPGGAAAEPAGACMMQGTERLQGPRLRAIGTEPFWAATIEGRCVTYSHPEDQAGTRVWTRYSPTADGGTWTGALGGRAFELRTRRQPGCSDGMSDRDYPIAVELVVGGERRQGCAAPS